MQKLLGIAGHHRAAQNGRRGIIGQKTHGHEFQSFALDGKNAILIVSHWPFVAPKHWGDAWAVEVAIAKTHSGAG